MGLLMIRKWRLTPKSITYIAYKNVNRLAKNDCVWFCCNANGDYNCNIPLVFHSVSVIVI